MLAPDPYIQNLYQLSNLGRCLFGSESTMHKQENENDTTELNRPNFVVDQLPGGRCLHLKSE